MALTPPDDSVWKKPESGGPTAGDIFAFIGGAAVFIVIDFVLAFALFGSNGGHGSPGLIVTSWLVTGVAFWLLYSVRRWAGYGVLGGFAGLFVLLVVFGSLGGPYTCFGAFGYPSSSPYY